MWVYVKRGRFRDEWADRESIKIIIIMVCGWLTPNKNEVKYLSTLVP